MGEGIHDHLEEDVAACERSPGLSMGDILALPDPLGRLCSWMLRQQQVSNGDVVGFLEGDEQRALECLQYLRTKGFIRDVAVAGNTCYRLHLAPTRRRVGAPDVWRALQAGVED